MNLLKKFLLLTRGKQIALVVLAIHLFSIFSMFGHHLFTQRMRPPRPIAVRTISPPQPSIQTAKREEKPKPVPPVKKETAANKPKTAPPKQAAAAKKQSAAAPKQPILKEIGESLETLSEKPKLKPRTALNLPEKIETKTEPSKTIDDPNYGEFLIAFLQNTLDLPEYGEVKAQIEIDRFGQLVSCKILQTKSSKNAEFIKNQLPELTFPCLNDFGILENTRTFTITFRNVEMH